MQSWNAYAKIVTALFVIANPVGVIPTFISLTGGYSATDKRRTSQVTAATVFIVLVAAAVFGEHLLRFFGISIASFRVGGGILILLMAIGMLGAKPSRAHYTPEETEMTTGKESVAVVPLAVPLVAGPGAISTVIIYANHAATWFDTSFLLLASLFVAVSVWVALRLAGPISTVLGGTGIKIVTRLMGLILAAVAVEFIAEGSAQLLPGLGLKGWFTKCSYAATVAIVQGRRVGLVRWPGGLETRASRKALDRRTGDPLGGSSVLRRNRAVDEWLQQAIAGVHESRATGEMIDSCPHQGTAEARFQEGASRHEISRGI